MEENLMYLRIFELSSVKHILLILLLCFIHASPDERKSFSDFSAKKFFFLYEMFIKHLLLHSGEHKEVYNSLFIRPSRRNTI